MIKYLTTALVLLAVATSTAQAVRGDTTTLGIYNTGARFILTRADFGLQTATDILADMVIAYDTFQITTTIRDTGRTSRIRHSYEKRCNSISGLARNKTLFKDKIVLMDLNKDCDVTQLCLLAQRSGAKAFVFVHNSNSNGNIHLPKKGTYPDSIRIPVFVVGNEYGKRIGALLPSKAGIKTKVLPPTRPQQLVASSDSSARTLAANKTADKVAQDANGESTNGATAAANASSFKGIGWDIAPNPVSNEVTLNYNFKEPNMVKVDIFNEIGQLVTNYQLPDTQTGKLEINVMSWQNGEYNVRLTHGKLMEVKRMVVVH